jgi:DnaJ-class molecular chaperone
VIIVRLSVPKKLSGEQRELLEEYAKSEDIPVHEAEVSFWEKLKGTVTGS